MRCEFLNIKDGRVTGQCKSNMASKRSYAISSKHPLVQKGFYEEGTLRLCPAHARKLGLYPADKEIIRRKRISENRSKVSNKSFLDPDKKGINDRILGDHSSSEEDVDNILNKENGFSLEMDKDVATAIIEGIFGDKEFILKDFLDGLEKDGIDWKTDMVMIDCVVIWWMADGVTRVPQTIQEVAVILDITMARINKIIDSNTFRAKLNSMRFQRYNRIMPILEKRMMIRALMGESSAESWIKSIYKKMEESPSDYDPLSGIDPVILEKLDSSPSSTTIENDSVRAMTFKELINQ